MTGDKQMFLRSLKKSEKYDAANNMLNSVGLVCVRHYQQPGRVCELGAQTDRIYHNEIAQA